MSGEYPTASAVALWLACHLLQQNQVPAHMIKRMAGKSDLERILIYNTYLGLQHSLILIDKVDAPVN
jgi:hypothetical protein